MEPGDAQRAEADLLALGQAVRRRREGRAWTIETLAHEAGVSRRTVLNLESGRHSIGVPSLFDLAAALGVRPSVLIAEAEPERDDTT